MPSKDPQQFKVVVIGDGGVGKSALTVQYVSRIFLDFHDPTIEDAYQVERVIDGETNLLDILDTAGQEELQTALNEQYLRQGDGYIAVYSLTDTRSFQRLKRYILALKRLRNFEKVPLVIVGNKLDLFRERSVPTADGLSLARELDCLFFETSAADRINVDDIFNGIVRQILHKKTQDFPTSFRILKPKLKRFKKFVLKKFHGSLPALPH